jgi:hypothetical protein
MPEVVRVERIEDLRPFDMLEEGRSVVSIRFGAGAGITTATVRASHEQVNGECLKLPRLMEERDEPYPEFLVAVMRPGPIPDLRSCPFCGTAVTSTSDD